MSNTHKQYKDGEFKPKEIRVRTTYRKLKPEIKDQMAKLYYLQNVKMSKIVKKYKISFSTLTDILKKYSPQAQRLPEKYDKKNDSNSHHPPSSPPSHQGQASIKLEVKLEQDPFVITQVSHEDDSPHYIFYG